MQSGWKSSLSPVPSHARVMDELEGDELSYVHQVQPKRLIVPVTAGGSFIIARSF